MDEANRGGYNKEMHENLLRADLSNGSHVQYQPIDLDDVLVNEIGQFGKFQIKNLLLMSFVLMVYAIKFDYNFTAASTPHRCRIPECGETHKDTLFQPDWLNNAIPLDGSTISSCERFTFVGDVNGTLEKCPAEMFDRNHTVPCEEFVYADDKTIVHEFNLGCNEWLRVVSGLSISVGQVLSLLFTGYIADRYGRRKTIIIGFTALGLTSVIRSFSVNYAMFLILQLSQALMSGGVYISGYILVTETVGPKYRSLVSAVAGALFGIGQISLATVAWMIPSWRPLLRILGVPCSLVIVYYLFASESVRWLLAKKKFHQAKALLMKIAKDNRKVLGANTLQALMKQPQKIEIAGMVILKKIIRSRVMLKRLYITPVWWLTANIVYYGLNVNSLALSDSKHLNYIAVCVAELPGPFLVLVFSRFGRRPTLASSYLVTGICNLAVAYLTRDRYILRLVMFMCGKLSIAYVFTVIYVFSAELYPTEYRNTMLSVSASVGRIGSVLAPLTPALVQYWTGLPSAIFSGLAIISSFLIYAQPETLGTRLPDTVAEAEALGRT